MPRQNTALMTDAEMDALIEKQKKQALIGLIGMIAGGVLLVVLAFFGSLFGILLGIILFGLGLYLRMEARKTIKKHIAEAALRPALNELFTNVHYDHDEHVPERAIRSADFGFSFQRVEGSDRIAAQYKGADIAMSDVTLKSVSADEDDDGTRTEKTRAVFQGLWLQCALPKRFAADLLIREKKSLGEMILRKGLRTADEAFNRQYYIESPDGEAALRMLSPETIEVIRAVDKLADGRIYLRLQRSGKLTLAVNSGHDFFEVKKIGKADSEELKQQFLSELRTIANLLDALLQ